MVIKNICVEIEEKHHTGRLFDYDVFNRSGMSISRIDLNLPQRKCFICKLNAKDCVREGGHEKSRLQAKMIEFKHLFYKEARKEKKKFADLVKDIAGNAIKSELKVTPKPGLVDLYNSGAHTDMDYNLMYKSADVIIPYFEKFITIGMLHDANDTGIIESLRSIGLKAEKKMFETTNGVNTYKGIIFSLGLLTAAAGSYFNNPFPTGKKSISQILSVIVSSWCDGLVENDFEKMAVNHKLTHGQEVYLKYGLTGARGIAETGFEIVLNQILPVYKNALLEGLTANDASLQALITLMANLNDTNIIYRANFKTLKEMQSLSRKVLDYGGMYTEIGWVKYKELINYVHKKGISPGGSADLLIVSLFLFKIENIFNILF